MAPAAPPRRLRVLVVGAGAAGCAAAWSLSRSPERFEVSLWDAAPVAGGVATTESVQLPDGTAAALNDGVQGGATSYRNCLQLHATLGFQPQPVRMVVAFGRGEHTWSNVGAPSALVREMQPHIARFGRVLRRVDALRAIFAFVPIRRVLRLWRFPDEFGERLVYPLTALFFGTGNRTPHVSAAIVARVFLDPQLRLFDYDPQRLLSQSPEMFAFQPLGDIYGALVERLRAAGVRVCLSRPCARVLRAGRRAAEPVVATDAAGAVEAFDRVVFACDAATALRLLAKPGFWERRVLGAVRYYDDVTYTHCDADYMAAHYELHADAAEAERPDYYIWSHPGDASKLEMSFDLGHYQPHLRGRPQGAPPIFQSIFLDKAGCRDSWTVGAIAPEKVLLVKWWRQFSHEASHFRRVVPFVRLAQGGGGGTTFFAGAWTLVNTHEVATVSGLAAALRLGADYPFADDRLARDQFDTYLSLAHGVSRPRAGCCA
jgi:predicted NAD/FAD-binding protein